MITNRKNLADEIPKLEKALGVDEGFFNKLSEEDDWSLIIKLHSLIEAAVSDLLVKRLQKNVLIDALSNMELSNKKSGKMAFVKALGLLGEHERRYISSLSELRNRLVHNIKNVNYQMHEVVEKMDSQQFKQFVKKFNTLSTEYDEDIQNLFRHDPSQALWYGGMAVLGIINIERSRSIN